jgi:general secretion pathway protein M
MRTDPRLGDTTVPQPEAGRAAPGAMLGGSLRATLAPLVARWQGLLPRERIGVAVAAAVLGLAGFWMLLMQPAWTTVRQAPARLDALDADLQRMQRLAAEARELKAATPVSTAQANLALKSATDRLGAAGQLVVQGDRATLTLNAVPSDALRAWMAEARGAARARPIEMRLTQSGAGYSGTLVVSLGGAP